MGRSLRRDAHRAASRARGITIEDLAIDSLGSHNTEEQTHLVQLPPGVSRVTFRCVKSVAAPSPEEQAPGIQRREEGRS